MRRHRVLLTLLLVVSFAGSPVAAALACDPGQTASCCCCDAQAMQPDCGMCGDDQPTHAPEQLTAVPSSSGPSRDTFTAIALQTIEPGVYLMDAYTRHPATRRCTTHAPPLPHYLLNCTFRL